MDAANSVWLLINADTTVPDITLLGAYTQVMFSADIASLKLAYTSYNTAKTVSDVVREERNDLQDEIYEILRKYRRNLPTAFAEGHAIVDSLPRLTPEAGSTPDGVTATAVWDAAQQLGKITFTASSDPNLASYQLRFCAGPNYSTEDETVVASLGPTDPREFLINAGLTEPGNMATFKVYVITATGNEKGSNSTTITRPGEE